MKQVILVRTDLQLPKGKLAAQVAHAAVEGALKSDNTREWRHAGQVKIVIKVSDQKELYKYIQLAKDQGLTTAVITDAGHTVVEPGTVTCASIGPDDDDAIDRIVGELKLL
ncbi:MAG: peptidyl-tRNA hydrolase Pth2 [Candidatus Woesearchaeota archaeon]